MLAETDLKKFFSRLLKVDIAELRVGDSDITLQLIDRNSSKILITSSVYNGGNFIPKSVRRAVMGQAPFHKSFIHSFLEVDENKSQILLRYVLEAKDLNDQRFEHFLKEFSFQVGEWRLFLDERDKNDLLPIFIK